MNGPNKLRRFDFDPTIHASLAYKDAVFISPHKFLGGPGSSGILICKKTLLYVYDPKPARTGGGTVTYVSQDHQPYYLDNIEELEESGTPGVIQDIRAGLVFQLKEQISERTIHEKSTEIKKNALSRLYKVQNLILLGNNDIPKVSIYSFNVQSRFGKLLHFNFITSLLNDLFGIQTRSGCMCASLWGHFLLSVDKQLAERF